jgi:hypothetical protein
MAKSPTKRKFAKKTKPHLPPEMRQMTNLAADYIKHWTTKELGSLQRNKTPICIPINNGYKIGTYTLIINKNKTCELHDANKEFLHLFDNKINAILYTVYSIKNQIKTAREIMQLDMEINKNSTDITAMRRSQERARARKEYDIVDIRQARLEVSEKQLEDAKDKILKIQRYAKFNKVWE